MKKAELVTGDVYAWVLHRAELVPAVAIGPVWVQTAHVWSRMQPTKYTTFSDGVPVLALVDESTRDRFKEAVVKDRPLPVAMDVIRVAEAMWERFKNDEQVPVSDADPDWDDRFTVPAGWKVVAVTGRKLTGTYAEVYAQALKDEDERSEAYRARAALEQQNHVRISTLADALRARDLPDLVASLSADPTPDQLISIHLSTVEQLLDVKPPAAHDETEG